MSLLQTSAFLLFFPLGAMAQINPDINRPNKIQLADHFPGADACIQIQNAIAALQSTAERSMPEDFSAFSPVR